MTYICDVRCGEGVGEGVWYLVVVMGVGWDWGWWDMYGVGDGSGGYCVGSGWGRRWRGGNEIIYKMR